MNDSVTIGRKKIGIGHRVYFVADLSANHNNDFERAAAIIRAAAAAGADAVKLQTYTADTMTLNCDSELFRIKGTTLWDGRTLHELYREAAMDWEWQPRLKALADELGLALFSTPFDRTAVDFLESMNVHVYKVASAELVDIPLLRHIAATHKPVILSTGMSEHEEILEALETLDKAGGGPAILLKCTAAYPARPEDMNLSAIPKMAEHYNLPVGLSDHSMDLAIPVTAVVLGACLVEKHLTLSRTDPGPDSGFSLEPDEFRDMVAAVRVAEAALGKPSIGPAQREKTSRKFRRSVFVTADMQTGEVFTSENIRCIRPDNGLHPRYLDEILGSRAKVDIPFGTPLAWEMVEKDRRKINC